jgi:hypothetical protein
VQGLENRRRLGEIIGRARRRAGYRHVKGAWQDVVGYSDRTLGDLERGNRVGDNVLYDVERVLHWPDGWCYRILDGEVTGPPPEDDAAAPDVDATLLRDATVPQLLAEIAVRHKTGTWGEEHTNIS